MIAIPAIDLRGGACVQLAGGDYAQERIRIADPCTALSRWEASGFARIHVVDLDAATGRGENANVVRGLIAQTSLASQVGGGIRTTAGVDDLLSLGAARVIVGTRAIEDLQWLREIAMRHRGRIVVAMDVRERSVVTHGWACSDAPPLDGIVDDLNTLPLAGVLVTAVHVEGGMQGPDLRLTAHVASRSTHPTIASGGVGRMKDLHDLAAAGASAVVIGMALYTGALDPHAVALEFSE